MGTVEDLFVQARHGRLFVRVWRGPEEAWHRAPLILLHDSLGCVALWRDFPARLAAALGRPVIAYDRLGFGRSDPHPGQLDVDFVRAEAEGGLRTVLEALAVHEFIAFGHSVGGGMAVGAAVALPGRCHALITESAQAFVEDMTRTGIAQAEADFQRPGQLEKLEKYHGAKAAWVLRSWVDTWLSPAFASWQLDDDLRRVRCPTLALHGDRDEYGSVLHPQRIAQLTGGTAVVLAACGHVPHREHTEVVMATVREWLANRARSHLSA